MPASEETGSGPVIHDHRRIDPVTGQVRGKHAASKPAGTAGRRPRPAGASGTGPSGAGGTGGAGSAGAADGRNGPDEAPGGESADEVLEGVIEDTAPAGTQAGAEARLAERTADLQRLQAEYANYRKRVDRDRAAVKEQAVASVLTGLLPVLDAIGQAVSTASCPAASSWLPTRCLPRWASSVWWPTARRATRSTRRSTKP